VVEIDALIMDPALDARRFDQVVHSIETSEHGRLAAPGGPDQGRDVVREDPDGRVSNGSKRPVVDGEILDIKDDLTVGSHGILVVRLQAHSRPYLPVVVQPDRRGHVHVAPHHFRS
jgi:hypothetical protein